MNGLLNIHKPGRLTSRRVVDAVTRVSRTDRVGHAGTLDPMATGVLVVCVGSATRLVPYIQNERKEYRAEFVLGQRSDTDDVTGQVICNDQSMPPARAEIEALLPRFVGRILQIPPAISAVHVAGVRAHKRTRRGEQLELAAREVEIHHLELKSYCYPRLELDIECGSGTYVRSIGRDLGEMLGCGAVMSALVRTRIGPFLLEDAVRLLDLTPQSIAQQSLPLLLAVQHLPRLACSESEVIDITCGRPICWRGNGPQPDAEAIALTGGEGELVALAACRTKGGLLWPRHVFHGLPAQPAQP